MKRRPATPAEHAAFIAAYPRPLERDVCGISEPPAVSWNDFTLGNWPESVVASAKLEGDGSLSGHKIGDET